MPSKKMMQNLIINVFNIEKAGNFKDEIARQEYGRQHPASEKKPCRNSLRE